jgi:hypothetical protein
MWRNSRLTTPQKRQSDCRRLGHSRLRVASRFTLRIGLASWQTQPPSHAKIAGGPPSLGVHEPSDSPQVTSCHSGTPLCDRPKLTKLSTRALCKLWAEHYWDRSIFRGNGLVHECLLPIAARGMALADSRSLRAAQRARSFRRMTSGRTKPFAGQPRSMNRTSHVRPTENTLRKEPAPVSRGGGPLCSLRWIWIGSESCRWAAKKPESETHVCPLRTPSGQAMS